MDYKKAGVDIEAGYKSVELMKQYVRRTMRPEALADFPAPFPWSVLKIWKNRHLCRERTVWAQS